MSGFEIAGIVLGAYPILFESAKSLRGALRKCKSWWLFEREFDDFLSEVQKEWVEFSQILEILLDPLDLAPDERKKLQDYPECDLWHEPHIQSQLQERIQPKYYEWFMGQLADMNNTLNELHDLLPIANVHLLDSVSLEAELFRLSRSFSSRKNKLLATVQNRNAALYNFLEKASHVERLNNSAVFSKSSLRANFKKVRNLQNHSHYAFLFLQNKWACSCSQRHHCGITIEQSETDQSISLLVSNEEKFTQIQLRFDTLLAHSQGLEQTKHDDVSQLKRQISLKRKLKKLKSKRSHSIIDLGISSLSLFSRKEKNSAIVSKPPETSQIGSPQPQGLVSEKNAKPLGKVRFAEEQFLTPPLQSNLLVQDIDNICDIASRSAKSKYEACEVIYPDTKLFLQVEPSETQQRSQDTVQNFIAATPRRDKRLRIGLVILRSILCLGSSPWIPRSWDKSHLIVLSNGLEDPQPYFKSPLLTNVVPGGDQLQQSKQTEATFFAIGVLLLELLFRETFEKQPFRAQFLDSMGRENEITDLCSALQWHQRVGEECGFEISEAIRRCVLCRFDTPPNLSDAGFIEAVGALVIKPLEIFLTAWNNDPGRNSSQKNAV
ncbi:hypothetical protein F5Y14DRAFT_321267 [Nemania sp. NC0429]|nr:hypothetical protein F5Y14DRAFT_321267 [Nemania sp. NC0429]